jgi:hypothetical protein
MGTSVGHGTLLERTSKFWRKREFVILNSSIINHGLMRNVQNRLIEGSRLNYSQSVVNEDNLSYVRQEASRRLRNENREYMKDKINELQSNSKNNNIRDMYNGITEFKKGYQPRTDLVKDDRDDLLADPHRILNKWKNYFCQLLNVQEVGGVRETEIQTSQTFVPELSASGFEVAMGKLKRHLAH